MAGGMNGGKGQSTTPGTAPGTVNTPDMNQFAANNIASMKTGGVGAYIPTQWNNNQGTFETQAPNVSSGTGGAKGSASQWPAWSGSQPHPVVQLIQHLANNGMLTSGDSGSAESAGGSGSMGEAADPGESEGESSAGDTGTY